MKHAIINNIKSEAIISGERGQCIFCNSEMVACCGQIKINHWKHKSLNKCDSWQETETEWHRSWKNQFPKDFQEIIMFDELTGEKHIADIYNKRKNLTIEIQHSPINPKEIKSRESFYKNLLWVIDLIPYKKNIVLHKNIKDAFFDEIIMKWARKQDKKIQEAKSPKEAKKLRELGWEDKYIDYFQDKYDEYSDIENYFLMQWKYQHQRWNLANAPIFFDLGTEHIYMNIETIKIWNGFLVKRFYKSEFIEKYKK